jgi:omega-6 fatty acid desaturase (delta-12 desaturase)
MKSKANGNAEVVLPSPPFTIKDVRDAIPPELFESSLPTSLYYLAKDVVLTTIVTLVTIQALQYLPAVVVFPIYWVVQGSVWFAFWILAHECGHGAFSKYRFVNDVIGLVLHSFLLVPYHSWRLSHSTHHKATNHIERDTAFAAATEPRERENVFLSCIYIVGYLFIGLPAYLLFGISGQDYKGAAWVSHFDPSSPIFEPRDHTDVVISTIGILTQLAGVAVFAHYFGFQAMLCWYFMPYLVVNFWLVLITFLQHTDVRVPKYKGDEFSYLRGGLGTIDRDFGIGNKLFHHITDSHVVHHCFSQMPFYNAIKATPYVKERIGKYYLSDNRPIAVCMWESFRKCKFIGKGEAEVWQF